ncbi:MAG: hypothetical protein HYR84_10520, partial [Planctomycetes bacterium]|nr:hypothetical protein [Planctomycetota bacterium]
PGGLRRPARRLTVVAKRLLFGNVPCRYTPRGYKCDIPRTELRQEPGYDAKELGSRHPAAYAARLAKTGHAAMPGWTFAIVMLVLMGPTTMSAQSPAKEDEPFDRLAKAFKPVLVGVLPPTLYEKSENWGHQVMVPVGLKWRGLRAQVQRSPRNHGEWRRLSVATLDLPRTLDIKIFDVKTVNPELQTLKVFLTFRMGVEYEQQNWESGARLWSGSARARAQVKLDMDCENILRVDLDKKTNLPDFVLRLRVASAKLHYDDLVFEHINGIGGDAAKLIGKAAHYTLRQWRPSIERDLLAKANDSIVKAADTREIRLGFGGSLKSK